MTNEDNNGTRNAPGNHGQYAGKVQPIDFFNVATMAGMATGFHEFTAISYIARWRKKGGVEDLQKAKWFLEELLGVVPAYGRDAVDTPRNVLMVLDNMVGSLIEIGGVGSSEVAAIYCITTWLRCGDPLRIDRAIAHLDKLIEQAK